MYESVIDLVGGEATMLFVELHYTLATEEAERIGVDHVARMSSNEAGESSLGELFINIKCNNGSDCDQM
jgi:COP9 signalosome complex subunit 6